MNTKKPMILENDRVSVQIVASMARQREARI